MIENPYGFKTRSVLLILCVLLCLFAAASIMSRVGAQSADPGSSADPLVSQSYVDERIKDVMALLDGSPAGTGTDEDAVMLQLEFLLNKTLSEGGLSFQPVQVQTGQSIIGKEGTELILRSGDGYAVTSFDTIVNATSGTDIGNDQKIPKNNLLIIPRDDGRGVRVTNTAWFMVKGGYTIN